MVQPYSPPQYPPATMQAIIAWLQGQGPEPQIDHATKEVIGFYEGPGTDPASVIQRITQRRSMGQPNRFIDDSMLFGQGNNPFGRSDEPTGADPGNNPFGRPDEPITGPATSPGTGRPAVSPFSNSYSGNYAPGTWDPRAPDVGPSGAFRRVGNYGGKIPELPGFGFTPTGPPRPLTDLGAPAFLSKQALGNLLPSEQAGRAAAISFTGIPLADYNAQQEQRLSMFSDRKLRRLPTRAR